MLPGNNTKKKNKISYLGILGPCYFDRKGIRIFYLEMQDKNFFQWK